MLLQQFHRFVRQALQKLKSLDSSESYLYLVIHQIELSFSIYICLFKASLIFCATSRDIQQESLKGVHAHWRHSFSFVNNHYLFLACFFIVLLSIMLYLLRLRRIHRHTAKRCTPSSVPWLEEGLGSPTLPINL